MSLCAETLAPGIHAFNRMADAGRLCDLSGFSDLAREQCRATAGKIAGTALTSLDNKVLCAVYCCCLSNPNPGVDGQRLMDSCATETLTQADALNGRKSRYKSQISYNMRENPPIPLMVKDDGRLSTVPLHHFLDGAHIRNRIKSESAGKTPYKDLDTRRPDLVILGDGDRAPTQENIVRIIDFKFPGDGWNPGQQEAYRRIAKGRVTSIDEQTCDCTQDQQRQTVELLAAAESHAEAPSTVERAAWTVATATLTVATIALALCPLDGPLGEAASGTAAVGAASRVAAGGASALGRATAARAAAMMRTIFSGGGRVAPAY